MMDSEIPRNRHVTNENEVLLCQAASKLSEELGGTDIVIIAAGKRNTRFNRCTTGSTIFMRSGARLRDLLGILEMAKEVEVLKHFGLLPKSRTQAVQEASE
jgi:hypothetical protein